MNGWQIGDLAVYAPVETKERRVTGPKPELGKAYRVIGLFYYHRAGLWLALEGAPDCLEGERNWGPIWWSRHFRKIRPDEHEACEEEFGTLLKRRKVAA